MLKITRKKNDYSKVRTGSVVFKSLAWTRIRGENIPDPQPLIKHSESLNSRMISHTAGTMNTGKQSCKYYENKYSDAGFQVWNYLCLVRIQNALYLDKSILLYTYF